MTGYLLHLVRHGENLTATDLPPEEERMQLFDRWYNAAEARGLITSSCGGPNNEIRVSLSTPFGRRRLLLEDAMSLYPFERLEMMPIASFMSITPEWVQSHKLAWQERQAALKLPHDGQ